MTVLVVAAHPDDEVLGCGGAIARHASRGERVMILLLADGEGARFPVGSVLPEIVSARAASAKSAAKTLGTEPPLFLGLPDNRLDTVALLDIVVEIEQAVRNISPAVIYTHHPYDLNVDHQVAARAVLTACRPLPQSTVRAIYAMEIPSSTEWSPPSHATAFVPRRFVDISDTMPRKLAALRCYDSEMRQFPHSRSFEAIEALARWRGASAGLHAAEAFDVLREIETP